MTKTGGGTQILTNTNTYNGVTAVNAGTLSVTGSIGSSNVTVSNADTVLASGTSGTIGNNVTIESGAILAAGGMLSVGKATVNAATTFESGSIFSWSLATTPVDTAGGTRGIGYEAVNTASLGATTGAIFRVVLDGAQDFSETFWATSHAWTDIFKTGDAGSALSFASVFSGGVQYYNASGIVSSPTTQGSFTINGSSLNWSAVPEPTSALAGLLLGAGLLRRRRCA